MSVETTSSPSVPSGTGEPVRGSTISAWKWSSQTWMPARAAQSIPIPGPPVSVMPMMSKARMRSSRSMRVRSSSDHISEPKIPTRSESVVRSNPSARATSMRRSG